MKILLENKMTNLFEEDSYLKEFKTKIEKINREEKYIKLKEV